MQVNAMLVCNEIRTPRDFNRKGADLIDVQGMRVVGPLPAPWRVMLYIEGRRTDPADPSFGHLEIEQPDGTRWSPPPIRWDWDGQGHKVGLESSVALDIDLSNFTLQQYGVYTIRFYGPDMTLLAELPYAVVTPEHGRETERYSRPLEDEGVHPLDEQGRVIRRPQKVLAGR